MISSTGRAYAGWLGYGACPAPKMIAWTTKPRTMKSFRWPRRSPMSAAPATRQRLRSHERQAEEHREADEARAEQRELLREEGRAGDRGVVRHPDERELVQRRERLQPADRDAPCRRVLPQHVALPHHEEHADADAADHVEEREPDRRADADDVVRRPHARVAAR